MLDPARIEGFAWDAGNSHKSADKHDVSQAESEQVFFREPLLLLADGRHSQREARYHALGRTDDNRLLHITITLCGDSRLIRVISARDMSRKERTDYARHA